MPGELSKRSGRHISPLRLVRRPAAVAAAVCGLAVAAAGVTGLALASQTGRPAAPVSKPTFVPVPPGRQEAAPPPQIKPDRKSVV